MRIRFQVRPSPAEAFPWECGDAQFQIGRASECKLRPQGDNSTLVSSRHAEVELTAAGAFLTDLKSTNGTFLNGNPVADRTALRVGDQIQFGHGGPKLEVLAIELPPSESAVPAPPIPPAMPAAGPAPLPPAVPIPIAASPAPPAVPATGRQRSFLVIAIGLAVLVLIAAAVAVAVRRPDRQVARLGNRERPPTLGGRIAESTPFGLPEVTLGPKPLATPRPTLPKPERKPEPPKPEPPKAIKIDEKPWMSADLVLINTGPQGTVQQAVAIEQLGEPPAYKVLAKLEDEAAARAAEVAWQSGVSIIADDQTLTRKVFGKVEPGGISGKEETDSLNRKWHDYHIVPPRATLVVFNDLKQVRTCVGYLAPAREFDPAKGEELWFRDVKAKEPALFERQYLQAGTFRKGVSDEVLRKLPGVDFLDYCVHHLASALTTPPDKRAALKIYVVGDVTRIALPENRSDMFRLHPIAAPRGDELRMRSESDRLIRESERVASELRARLNALGVPVAEWSKEMAFGSYDTDFRRPDFKQAHDANLLGVSHVLIFRVRTPQTRGMYELSMRLVDAAKGQMLWEGQGDRLKPEDYQLAVENAGSPYLMNTGKLALLELNSDRAVIDESTRAWAQGGVPLLLPAVRFKSELGRSYEGIQHKPLPQRKRPKRPGDHVVHSPEEMWGQDLRLGYLESEKPALTFRDLYSSHLQTIPDDAILRLSPVDTDASVPPAHEMRYLVWRLAKFILPTAGRVTEVNQMRVRLTLCRPDGIKQGDRLTVIHLNEPSGGAIAASETVLPQELIATAVTEVDSLANIEQEEGADPATAIAIQPGDVVHRRLPRQIVVAVMKPRVDPNAAAALGVRANADEVRKMTQWVGDQLCQLLQNAMVRLRLHVVERGDLQTVLDQQKNENFDINPALAAQVGRVTGATHVILSDISPGLYNEAPVGLRVVEVDSGMVMEQINFKFKRAQLEAWKP